MEKKSQQLLFLPEFRKFILASTSGRRLLPSGKKVRIGTLQQYQHVQHLLEEFEKQSHQILRIQFLHNNSMRTIQKEKNYWSRFFRGFTGFCYKQKGYYDQYTGAVLKVHKTFFHYLAIDKSLPVGDFHKKFRVPSEQFIPVTLSPAQLRFFITNKDFEEKLRPALRRTKDIFVFGCTVGLRFGDLMQLRKTNIQYTAEGVYIFLHTQKTGAVIKILLPDYALDIIKKYEKKAGRYVLPRLSSSNLNLQIKSLVKKAGWDYSIPKIRNRQGEPVEIKTKTGSTYRFYDHITVHTMRRTAITTLLLMGVDENSVRRISGHAPGSKEFYRYVVIVQDFLNARVKEAYQRLIQGSYPSC